MYKLLFFFALLGLAFAAPAPQAPLVFSQPLGYPSPYLQSAPVIYPAGPAAYPSYYPAGPITYTKYF